MKIRRRVVAHGRVQGVFFRDSCRVEAETRGVAGTVRNRADGAVEAVFEGEDDAVEVMTCWMRSGPAHAFVERVEVVDEPVAGERGFRIL